jgi:DNA polymerase-3 subunit epsilon
LYAIIDIETTGQAASTGKITEIAIFVHDGFQIIDSFSSLINPECYIPGFITSLTGIDNEMVRNSPKFYEVARRIVEMTQDKFFVAHNVSFDYKFIQEEFKRLGYDYQRKTMCTVRMGRKFLPGHQSYSLGKLCDELGIFINGRHRAAGDALATVKLFEIILARKAEKETKQPPGQLRLF